MATPTLELVLLCVLVASDPLGVDQRSRWLRRVSIGLVVLMVGAALWATIILTDHLIDGAARTNSAEYLLASGALVLIGNTCRSRSSTGSSTRVDPGTAGPQDPLSGLRIPQHLNPDLAPPTWRPIFVDYLYLGFTNSTAFSPTDVMPLVPWAKSAMAVQSTVSLVVIGLVIARAVNIFT